MNSWLSTIWVAILGAVVFAVLASCRSRLRGTTLIAPLWWAVVSFSTLVLVEIAAAFSNAVPTWASAARYIAVVTTFGPIMAVLGAKRPQDKAWQFIVGTLLLILALPSGESLVFRGGADLALHTAQEVFLTLLIVVGVFNYLPTRFWLAAILYGAGQALLLAEFLPWFRTLSGPLAPLIGMTLLALAATSTFVMRKTSVDTQRPLDCVWIDFRNAFGAVWGLRIAERVNSEAKMYGWNVHLSWHGLVSISGQPATLPPEIDEAVRKSLKTLLRRFVSPEWIDERL